MTRIREEEEVVLIYHGCWVIFRDIPTVFYGGVMKCLNHLILHNSVSLVSDESVESVEYFINTLAA